MMKKIGIIICGRYQDCGGGKCFRALRERVGAFSIYPADETVEIVGYSYCGGCPGGNIEYVPEEMKKNGAEIIHLATGLLVGYPPCPRTEYFKTYLEKVHNLKVVIGTHPIPLKYLDSHALLSTWTSPSKQKLFKHLLEEDRGIMESYN
jgi:predicted metal-binding protein